MSTTPGPSSHRFERCVVHLKDATEYGTAFLIDKQADAGIFLTAFHVVSAAWCRDGRVLLQRGASHEFHATIEAVNEARDIALLRANIPPGLDLKPAPVSFVPSAEKLVVFQMLSPDSGIVAPLMVAVPFVGHTAVTFKVGGNHRNFDRVWSQQGLVLAGGVSGAPAVSSKDDAIVAVACAGADALGQAFFIPLNSANHGSWKPDTQSVSQVIAKATELQTRLGKIPNRRGIALRCWLQTRRAVETLIKSGVYDRHHTISRQSLDTEVETFLNSVKSLAVVAGPSGTGKSVSLARLARSGKLSRRCILIRAAQIKPTSQPLEDALKQALSIESLDDISKAAPQDVGPLLIFDGINELPIRPHEWPGFVQNDIAMIADLLERKGWKLLFSTRTDRLDDLRNMQNLRSLYDPQSESERPGSRKIIPFLRLDGFDRSEYDHLAKQYGLPTDLPFAALRHPIVFRLLVDATRSAQNTKVHVKHLFEEYLDNILTRIHSRCQTRSRDKIFELIETLTALPETNAVGFIETKCLGDTENEAIAEAAVAEGLWERVAGGYRYIYDEVFDFVRAKRLIDPLTECATSPSRSAIDTIKEILKTGCTPGAVARAIEILLDRNTKASEDLSEKLSTELDKRNCIDKNEPGYMMPILELSPIIQVLSRVEKGGPFDNTKNKLPLFGIHGAEPWEPWSHDSTVPFGLSEAHISYAFSEDQIWQMVRLSAEGKWDRDSYPFRSKDIEDDHAFRSAESDLKKQEKYKVLNHFITGFPEKALNRLAFGLSDDTRIGREHSFSSFCAQAIAAYADYFNLPDLIRLIIDFPRSLERDELLCRIFKLYPLESCGFVVTEEAGLSNKPEWAAYILTNLAQIELSNIDEIANFALHLIQDHQHPAFPFSFFFSHWIAANFGLPVRNWIEREWTEGKISPSKFAQCCNGLVPPHVVFETLLKSLSEKKFDLRSTIWAILECIDRIPEQDEKNRSIDELSNTIRKSYSTSSNEVAYSCESILYQYIKYKFISKSASKLIEEVCKNNPDFAGVVLQYPIGMYDFDYLPQDMQKAVCDIVIKHLPMVGVMEVLYQCLERAPGQFRTKYILEGFVHRFTADELFNRVANTVARYRRFGSSPDDVTIKLIAELRELEPATFQRYEAKLKYISE